MSFLVYYLILYLCVSMHACNSRHLGVFRKEPGKELTIKTTDIEAEFEGRNFNENNIEPKESTLEFLSYEQNMHKGNDIKVQISQEGNIFEEWNNHARSTMESKKQDSKQQDSKEAINNPKDNNFTEDVVVMDYAQPHRKPPIHNLEP